MSGTSLDGVDAALVEFEGTSSSPVSCRVIHTHSLPYSDDIRAELHALHVSTDNELQRTAVIGNVLARLYADAVNQLLVKSSISPASISAIGCHGQTIRHRPEFGFTLQIGNPALLAELTGINVVADFRSRDIAAGGHGAPLVPAFHHALLSHPVLNRAIINIGGIANLSYLPVNGVVTGFDTGPGNMLMDAWIERHKQSRYDQSGQWAQTGTIIPELLKALLSEPYFALSPPKSTGRDLFSIAWLEQYLRAGYLPEDVQRTLLELTARSIVEALDAHCSEVDEIYLCGGGAHNVALFQCLQQLVHPVKIGLTDEVGISVGWVEAAAFAWLARQSLLKAPGNLPAVTGARGPRILGAVYAY